MGSEWSETSRRGRKWTTRRDLDAEIGKIARRQKQLISTEQIEAIGVSRGFVSKRVSGRRLFVVHRGVFALHPPPYSTHQRYLAAVMACGPLARLAGWAAAHMRGIAERAPKVIEVISPTGRGRGLAGVTVHRADVARGDGITIAGIPCTNATRTIVDLARTADEEGLEDLLLAADSKRSLDRRRLEALLDERQGQPGTKKLRDLITDDPVVTRSKNERRMFSICREFGVRLPLTDEKIVVEGQTFYADFLWPDINLVVEAQSWRWHGGRTDQASDANKGQLLTTAGYRVVYFTRDQILKQRSETGRRLVALTDCG